MTFDCEVCVATALAAIYAGLIIQISTGLPHDQIIKIADWDGGVSINVVFVHGLGGQPRRVVPGRGQDAAVVGGEHRAAHQGELNPVRLRTAAASARSLRT
jgi:hypothetical protein